MKAIMCIGIICLDEFPNFNPLVTNLIHQIMKKKIKLFSYIELHEDVNS